MHLDLFPTLLCLIWWPGLVFHPPLLLTLCRDIYTDSKFSICTSSGLSPPITQSIGIKQGCPLSPILFNLSLQGLLEGFDKVNAGYRFDSTPPIRYLTYADDLCIFGNSKSDITSLISVFEEFLTWSRLSIKPAKCCSLSCINSVPRKYVQSFSPSVLGQPIRPLTILGRRHRSDPHPYPNWARAIHHQRRPLCLFQSTHRLAEGRCYQHLYRLSCLLPPESCQTLHRLGHQPWLYYPFIR